MAATTDPQFAEPVRMYRNPMLLNTHMLSLELRLRSSPIKPNSGSVCFNTAFTVLMKQKQHLIVRENYFTRSDTWGYNRSKIA